MRARRAVAWLVAAPLIVAGSQVAHVLAFRLVYPQASVRLKALLSTGHGYMVGIPDYLPLVMGVLGGMELVALAWGVVCELRRTRQASVPAWAFALMPLLGFAIQEFLERWFAGVSFPWQVVLEPVFQVGLLLQLPFGVLAFVVARLLSRAAVTVGRVLRAAEPLRLAVLCCLWSVSVAWPPRPAALAAGHAGRGPPFLPARRF